MPPRPTQNKRHSSNTQTPTRQHDLLQHEERKQNDHVPGYPLPAPLPAPDLRWAWTIEPIKRGPRIVGTVVHSYDCVDSPERAEELNLDQALTVLRRAGARACLKCEAAVALGPLV
ncbi:MULTISPECIES: DUF6233 domain-containing protein [unclassified Streptomyces]|uniref:DUF6233 domain-containing protein n=1 Tax=unclassified Streptomyces TaxID=2593676 RepID=UPI00380D6D43